MQYKNQELSMVGKEIPTFLLCLDITNILQYFNVKHVQV